MASLNALPNELLSLVTNYLDRPKDVLNLALSSRNLDTFVKLDGWKAFLKGRFGLTGLDPDARGAVHGLTTLYRNWDRKAFTARYLEPPTQLLSMNTWEKQDWNGSQGQTMGYRPSIDSYEDILTSWSDRREVLAWSAGTQIVLRVRHTGSTVECLKEAEELHSWVLDDFRHANAWCTYKIPESSEGRDDITALRLVRPEQKQHLHEHIAFGTASGRLSLLNTSTKLGKTQEQIYNTDHRSVGSLSLSAAHDPLMAVTLGDSSLALYPTNLANVTDDPLDPWSQTTLIASGTPGRLWSCNFLSNNRVAAGLGPSAEPIQVYDVTPTGFLAQPLRKFSLESSLLEGTRSRNTSVYPTLPVSSGSRGGSEAGHVFLSGGYDGLVRLHDMRSPRNFEKVYWDVTNDSSIYSLAMHGLERVVAGTSMHSMLKVFDLRLSGSHAYHTIPLLPSRQTTKTQDFTFNAIVNDLHMETPSVVTGGWNLYLNPRDPTRTPSHRTPHRRATRIEDSPVYSLSIPSLTSPNLYTGLEGTVQSLTFVSVSDPHPDPLLSQSLTYLPDSNAIDIKPSYNLSNDVLNLGMYEQGSEEGLGMRLMVQDEVGRIVEREREESVAARFATLDARWKDPSEDGEKWRRGQEPQEPPIWRGGRRGRGRRRGRDG